MKKYFCLLLVFSLILCFSACGQAAVETTGVQSATQSATEPSTQAATFMAGYGCGDISSLESVPIAGSTNSSERMSTGYHSYLYSNAIALQDTEGNRALIVNVDAVTLKAETTDPIRDWAQETYGIPRENILIAAIHQHSCPDPYNASVPSAVAYKKILDEGIRASITAAIEDLAPAEMQFATVQTEAMSFVRNYWANDGTIVGDNYGSAASGIKAHESESDKEMRLIKFTRGDEKDIILVNFQAHPHLGCTGENRLDIHSDWPGVMRDQASQALSCHVVYMSGASGNLNSNSRIPGETVSKDYRDHGRRAAEYVIGAEGTYTPAKTGTIRAKELTISYNTDHSLDHLVSIATIVHNARSQGTEYAKEVMANYPEIHSVFHATAIVQKADRGPTYDLTISAISIGDAVFTVHPYEVFDTNGMELRSGTIGNENYTQQLENPFPMTMIASLANGWEGYVPSQLGYTNGGYSTDITKFAPGTGEELITDYLEMLSELYAK